MKPAFIQVAFIANIIQLQQRRYHDYEVDLQDNSIHVVNVSNRLAPTTTRPLIYKYISLCFYRTDATAISTEIYIMGQEYGRSDKVCRVQASVPASMQSFWYDLKDFCDNSGVHQGYFRRLFSPVIKEPVETALIKYMSITEDPGGYGK